MLNHSFLRYCCCLHSSTVEEEESPLASLTAMNINYIEGMKQPVTLDNPQTYVLWDIRSNEGIVFWKDMELLILVNGQLKSHWREAMEIYLSKESSKAIRIGRAE